MQPKMVYSVYISIQTLVNCLTLIGTNTSIFNYVGNSTTNQFYLNVAPPNGTIYWHVKAFNGQSAAFSEEIHSFRYKDCTDAPPMVLHFFFCVC